jgi:hypothetical protein
MGGVLYSCGCLGGNVGPLIAAAGIILLEVLGGNNGCSSSPIPEIKIN